MFRNVIVGVDQREGGRDAVALGRRLLQGGGVLTLAHVYPAEIHPWRGASLPYDAVERQDSAALLRRIREETGVAAGLRSIGAPSVGRGLHMLAEELGADLLVVGSTHTHSLLGRVFLADDTRSALNGAPCAVAVAPAGYAGQPQLMREIGVAYDGSPESEHALSVARTLAAEHGAKLSAFEAVAVPARALSVPPEQTDIDDLVSDARKRVESLEGVEPHAAYGRPAEELAPYSASLDLLLVGSRSYGPVGRMMHGSTTLALARSARCPLLVLTRATRAAASGTDESVVERVPHEVGAGTQS